MAVSSAAGGESPAAGNEFGQVRVDDHAIGGRELRRAGRHRHQRPGGCRSGVIRDGQDDLPVGRWDDLASDHSLRVRYREVLRRRIAEDGVDVPRLGRLDDHRIARLQLVEVQERLALADPVPGDGEVTDAARQRRPVVVARTLRKGRLVSALDDREVVVRAQARDVQVRDAGPGRDRRRRLPGQSDDRVLALRPFLDELLLQLRLLDVREDVGDPDLVDDEEQDHQAGGDQRLAEPAQPQQDVVPLGGTAGAGRRGTTAGLGRRGKDGCGDAVRRLVRDVFGHFAFA